MRSFRLTIYIILVFFIIGCSAPQTKLPPFQSPEKVHTQEKRNTHIQDLPKKRFKSADSKDKLGNELEEAVKKLRKSILSIKKELNKEVIKSFEKVKGKVPKYKIRPGDVLEIIYHTMYEENPAEYILEVQDLLNVEFLNQPELSRTVRIRTDGKINLPLIGEIEAAGLTTRQLKQKLLRKYKKYLVNPVITIYLQEFNVKIRELKKAITTAARGQSKILPVRPDGCISLPFIGDVKVAGHTVEEVHKIIVEKYTPYVRNLEVTIIVKKVINPTIYVFGEVNSAGELSISGPLYLSQVISRAKGLKPTADIKNVIIIRRRGVVKPVVMKVNLAEILKKGDISKDIPLVEDDVVYIPRLLRQYFFVCGEVKRPGVYPLNPESPITVSQAIAIARGKLTSAALSSVIVLRREQGKQAKVFKVNVKRVLTKGDLKADMFVHKNDIIFVPKTFIAKVDDFIDQWFTKGLYSLFPADSTLDFIIDLWTVMHLGQIQYFYAP